MESLDVIHGMITEIEVLPRVDKSPINMSNSNALE